MTEKINITKSKVDGLDFNQKGQTVYWDKKLLGFGVRVGVNRKTYIVQKKIHGKDVKVSLGVHGQISPEKVRDLAFKALAEMTQGINPIEKKRQDKAKSMPLVEVYNSFLNDRVSFKPRTVRDYKYVIEAYFGDWQKKPITSITRDMVSRRHKEIGGGKGGKAQANQAMRYLRAIFNYAYGKYCDSKGKSIIEGNPVDVLTQTRSWYSIQRKQTLVKPHELPALFYALDKVVDLSESSVAETTRDYIIFLLFTGMRKGEAAQITWDQIDFTERTLTITDTKNKQPLSLPISVYLLDLLKRKHEKKSSLYVFPARDKTKPIGDPKRQLNNIRKNSGLSFSFHDIRRTFITIADSLEISPYAIKRLVNHTTSGDVTGGYIVHDVERLRKPVQLIADRILKYAGIGNKGEVVDIKSKLIVS